MATSKSRSDYTGRVLEKVDRKSVPDDTIPLTASIYTYRILSSHVEYSIRVQRGLSPEEHWDIYHRYSDFDNLNQSIQVSDVQLKLPPKKVFKNTDRQFLTERQKGLQDYIEAVLRHPFLSSNLIIKRFLDPQNYSENFHDSAYRNVSMFFRSNPEWNIVEPLRDIGWRIRKHYYLISSKVNPKAPNRILSWSEPGPDFCVAERDLEVLLKILVDLRHPNILSPSSATYSGSGLFITRNFYPYGSLRDKIYSQRPGNTFLTKYSNPPPRLALTLFDVKKYGRQILDVLQFLLEKGFVLGHLHAGNVIIEDDVCKLTELENSLIGIPPFYRTFLLDLRKVQGPESEIVYAFGHLLYEMACGTLLKTSTMEAPPPSTHHEVIPILECILSPAGVKSLPTISDLIANPFFAIAGGTAGLEKPSLKVPSRLKEILRMMRERYDIRLQDNQRKVSQFRRLSKAHESLMSEEERQKRRKKFKKEKSLQETQETPEAYPTSKLTRQSTLPSSQSTVSKSKTKTPTSPKSPSNSKSTPAVAPTQPSPETHPQPAPSRKNNERGALLGSIETFSVNKLKKAKTNDRSAPVL